MSRFLTQFPTASIHNLPSKFHLILLLRPQHHTPIDINFHNGTRIAGIDKILEEKINGLVLDVIVYVFYVLTAAHVVFDELLRLLTAYMPPLG